MPETGSCPKCGSVSWKPARPPQRKPEPRPPATQAEAQWAGYSRPEAFGPMDESPDGRMRRELDI
jgi:hypothetical protein